MLKIRFEDRNVTCNTSKIAQYSLELQITVFLGFIAITMPRGDFTRTVAFNVVQ